MFIAVRAFAQGLQYALFEMREARRMRKVRFARALEFNSRHTFTTSGESRWMCPTCMRQSLSLHSEPHVGPVFRACCEFPEGGRASRKCAVWP